MCSSFHSARLTASPTQQNDVLALKQVEHLRKRLKELDRGISQVIEQRFIRDRGIEETARILKISPSTVKSRSREGITWLRGRLATKQKPNRLAKGRDDATGH
jgi:DNA-directed RNA polymerase specialized sigma24 family protein